MFVNRLMNKFNFKIWLKTNTAGNKRFLKYSQSRKPF